MLPRLRGAFSLVFCDEQTLYAARDPQGIRPLVLGRLERGWVVASESAALDIVGASFVREVRPGELVEIDADGLRCQRFATPDPKGCLFEYVYLARPDTEISGRSVHATRVEVGRRLAAECPAEADLVIPVPESGTPAAVGYAEASGIPYGLGLVKNSYVGRTFIQPSQTLRQLGIRLKLNPLREIVGGKRLVVVDDTIVRGNTQRALVRMLREAGAREVHVRISAPPVITTAPPPEARRWGMACLTVRKVPVRLVSSVARHSSRVISSMGHCMPLIPALAKTACRPPKRATVSSTAPRRARLVGHVRGEGQGPPPRPLDLRRHLLRGHPPQIHHPHRGPLLREPPARGRPDPRSAPGHQRHPICESHGPDGSI